MVINSGARQGGDWPRAHWLAACAEAGLPVTAVHVVPGEACAEMVARCIEAGARTLIIGGGDGTMLAAATAIAGHEVRLGVVPLGTTNNFARSLGVPLEPLAALRVIARGQVQPVHVGSVNGRRFVNVASLGVSTEIAQEVQTDQKRRFGRLAYALLALRQTVRHRSFVCMLTTREGRQRFSTHQLIVANGRYHAGLEVAPTASLVRPDLTLLALGVGHSRWHHLRNAALFVARRHTARADMLLLAVPEIRLECWPAQDIEADGEVVTRTPAVFQLSPERLAIFVP